VTALENVTRLQNPHLIPKTLTVVNTQTPQGALVSYTTTEFVADSMILESVWSSLSAEAQESLVNAVVDALKKLSKLNISYHAVHTLLAGTMFVDSSGQQNISGPTTGYAQNVHGFLIQLAKNQTTEESGNIYHHRYSTRRSCKIIAGRT
jgi:hypothetical protein